METAARRLRRQNADARRRGFRHGLLACLSAGTLSAMKALVQRVTRAEVVVGCERVGAIAAGLCAFIGVGHEDEPADAVSLADRLVDLRIFEDSAGKMNLSLADVGGEVLVVSQFTLYGNAEKGRRPSFIDAARPDVAIPLYESFVAALQGKDLRVETGEFGAMMDVELVNDGPVTLWLER